jgi:hypothetical protein
MTYHLIASAQSKNLTQKELKNPDLIYSLIEYDQPPQPPEWNKDLRF